MIGRRNIENVAKLLMRWDTNHNEHLEYEYRIAVLVIIIYPHQIRYSEFAAAYPKLAVSELSQTPSEVHLSLFVCTHVVVHSCFRL